MCRVAPVCLSSGQARAWQPALSSTQPPSRYKTLLSTWPNQLIELSLTKDCAVVVLKAFVSLGQLQDLCCSCIRKPPLPPFLTALTFYGPRHQQCMSYSVLVTLTPPCGPVSSALVKPSRGQDMAYQPCGSTLHFTCHSEHGQCLDAMRLVLARS